VRAGRAVIAVDIVAWAGLLSLGSAACFTSAVDESCRTDRDCADLVCTRVGECASASSVYALRIEWTVNGVATDQAGACGSIGDLELGLADPTSGGQHAVRPVPCSAGVLFFDKLPIGYTDVTITAYSAGGSYLDSRRGSAVGSNGVVRIDLRP
jgi:hypothetical protein